MSYYYVAYPVDQAGTLEPVLALDSVMNKKGIPSFFPSMPWAGGKGLIDGQAIFEVNQVALSHSWGIVAVLPDDTPTLGVPLEIQKSIDSGKPTIIYCGNRVMDSVQVHAWTNLPGVVVEGLAQIPDFHKLHRQLRGELVKEVRHPTISIQSNEYSFSEMVGLGQAYDGDAGFDLQCSVDVDLRPGQYQEIPCGFNIEMPPDTWGWLCARSSTARKRLLVNQAVIDQGYRGPMWVGVTNLKRTEIVSIRKGDRLAQLIPMPLMANSMEVRWADNLSESERGDRGFGSSGR